MMRTAAASLPVALAIIGLPWVAAAETVHFNSAATAPTPLQQRLAQERAQPIREQSRVELAGELYRPAGDGPFPAVVLLHGCAGRSSREAEDFEGSYYAGLGYALLIVDSFSPRGIAQRCDLSVGPPVDRVMDAYGALLYLAQLPFIDPARIAIVGYSQGGEAALSAVKLGGVQAQFDRQFSAVIAYYPGCEISLTAVSAPTLVLIGELDETTPAANCREMMARRSGAGAPLRLVVYPSAYHSFNSVRLRGKPDFFYGRREYNEAADRAAREETLAALRHAFARR
jgi:dienelactone hydrolase